MTCENHEKSWKSNRSILSDWSICGALTCLNKRNVIYVYDLCLWGKVMSYPFWWYTIEIENGDFHSYINVKWHSHFPFPFPFPLGWQDFQFHACGVVYMMFFAKRPFHVFHAHTLLDGNTITFTFKISFYLATWFLISFISLLFLDTCTGLTSRRH